MEEGPATISLSPTFPPQTVPPLLESGGGRIRERECVSGDFREKKSFEAIFLLRKTASYSGEKWMVSAEPAPERETVAPL